MRRFLALSILVISPLLFGSGAIRRTSSGGGGSGTVNTGVDQRAARYDGAGTTVGDSVIQIDDVGVISNAGYGQVVIDDPLGITSNTSITGLLNVTGSVTASTGVSTGGQAYFGSGATVELVGTVMGYRDTTGDFASFDSLAGGSAAMSTLTDYNTAGNPLVDLTDGSVTVGSGDNLDLVDGDIGIGTAPTDRLHIVAGALSSTQNIISQTGSNANAGGLQYFNDYQLTSAGTAALAIAGLNIDFLSGYTGSGDASGIRCIVGVAGTAQGAWNQGAANVGIRGGASASTSGHNGGVFASCGGSTTLNVAGSYIAGYFASAAGDNVAVYGSSDDADSGNAIGGLFVLDSSTASVYTVDFDAALACDNRAQAANIFVARDNSTDVFTIADGGDVTVTEDVTVSRTIAAGSASYDANPLVPVTIFVATADSTAIVTTGEQAFDNVGVTLNADTIGVSTTYRIKAWGTQTSSGGPTLIMDVDIGGVDVATVTPSAASGAWQLESFVTVRGTGPAVATRGYATGFANSGSTHNASSATIDTTVDNLLTITVDWSTASGESITCEGCVIQCLRP